MVERVLIPTPTPLWLHNLKTGLPASHGLLDTHHTAREGRWWITPPCLEILGWKNYLPPKDFQGSCDYQEVREEETVALAMVLQSCTVQSGMPQGVLCGVVQELCQCLAPLIEDDGLLNMKMLDVAEKDPVTPAPASAPSSPTPGPEEEEQIQIPEESHTLEPEEVAHSEGGLDLTWGRHPIRPPGFAHSQLNQTHRGLVKGVLPRAQLDLCSMGSLQLTISHNPAARDVHYEYQSQVITQASLRLPLFESSEPSNSPSRIQELWVNTMLFLLLVTDLTTPQPQKWLKTL